VTRTFIGLEDRGIEDRGVEDKGMAKDGVVHKVASLYLKEGGAEHGL
jgi:hypothetical protein